MSHSAAPRANRPPLLITGIEPGRQLMTTTDVDNWPGDVEGLQGYGLASLGRLHQELRSAKRFRKLQRVAAFADTLHSAWTFASPRSTGTHNPV
jgi:thioredoxin reductase